MADKLLKLQVGDDITLLFHDNGDGTCSLASYMVGGVSVALGAGELHIGNIGAEGDTLVQKPVVTAGAYQVNDAVGGLLTFANAARVSGGGGVIKSLIIVDDALQSPQLELWLFNQTFTAIADNAAWDPTEADLENLVGVITTDNGAWFATASHSAADVEASKRYDLAGTSLFGQLVTREIFTPAAIDDITVKMGVLQD